MTTSGALDEGQSNSCQNGSLEKWWPEKDAFGRWDAMIGWTYVVSHHLRSLLGAIKLTVLCVIVC